MIHKENLMRKASNSFGRACGQAMFITTRRLLTLNELYSESVHQQAQFTITSASVSQALKKIANWKAPGSDAVRTIWLKHLPSLHQRIATQLQHAFVEGPQAG